MEIDLDKPIETRAIASVQLASAQYDFSGGGIHAVWRERDAAGETIRIVDEWLTPEEVATFFATPASKTLRESFAAAFAGFVQGRYGSGTVAT